MQYVDEFSINLKDTDIFEIEMEDYPMHLKVPVHRETLEAALTESVENGDLSDWLIDKVQEMIKNRWSLGEISDMERDRAMTVLEVLRI